MSGKKAAKPIWEGKASSGEVELHVYHVPRAVNNRIIISIDADANCFTWRSLCSLDGGRNYGNAHMTATLKAAAIAVNEEINHNLVKMRQANVVSHCCGVNNKTFNIVITAGKSISNARVIAAAAVNMIKPKFQTYKELISKLTDTEGKAIRASKEAFEAARSELERGLEKACILVVGGAKFHEKSEADDFIEKVARSIVKAGPKGSYKDDSSSFSVDRSSESIKFNGSEGILIYHYYTSSTNHCYIIGNELFMDGKVKSFLERADAKSSWAEKIIKSLGENVGAIIAFEGSGCGSFSAHDQTQSSLP